MADETNKRKFSETKNPNTKMVSWYHEDEEPYEDDDQDDDNVIIDFLKRHEAIKHGSSTRPVSFPDRLEELRKNFAKDIIKKFNISLHFPESHQTATPKYIQYNFKNRIKLSKNTLSITCEEHFIFHAEQIIKLIKKLIERVETLNETTDRRVFIKFLNEMIKLINDFILFIHSKKCNKYQNSDCIKLEEIPATVYSNQGYTGNCGVMGFTGSLFSYLITSYLPSLDSSKISIISILFTNEIYLLFLFCITYDVSICKEIIIYFLNFLFCYYNIFLGNITIEYMQQLFILWFIIKYIAEMIYSINKKKSKIPIYDLKNLQLNYFSNRGSTTASYFDIFDKLKKGLSLIQILLELQEILKTPEYLDSIHYANLIDRKTLEYLLELFDDESRNILVGRIPNINLFSYELDQRYIVGTALSEITGFSFGFTTPEGWREIDNSDIINKKLFQQSISADFDNDAFAEWFIIKLKDFLQMSNTKTIYAYGSGSGAFLIEVQDYIERMNMEKYLDIIRDSKTKFNPRYFQGHAFGLLFYLEDGNIHLIIINSWSCKPIINYNEEQIKFLIQKNKLTDINLIINIDNPENIIQQKRKKIGGSNKKYSKKYNKKRIKSKKIKYNHK
jgi:hypothetical protein